mgnify:CR=1 FL=1|tara:strand:+ start:1444 stop:2790 length:1347 start_codon:yes stop_codon:yes gene_type:complete
MRNLLIFIVFCFYGCESINNLTGNYPDLENSDSFQGQLSWVKTFGGTNEDIAHAVIETSDGGFAVFGNTKSVNGNVTDKIIEESDFWLLKFNSEAELEWNKTYGGSGDDRGHSLIQMEDNGFMLLGYSQSIDGLGSNNEGQHDNWVIRIDEQGDFIWERSFGYAGHDHAYNIIKTSDGGALFNGFLDVTASNGAGNSISERSSRHGVGEFWCHKINSQGTLEWRNYYGGTSNDRSYDAIELVNGNFILVGTTESSDVDVSDSQGSYDVWVVMIDSQGNLLWEKTLGGSEIDGANAVLQDAQGNIVVLGNSFSTDGNISYPKGGSDFWIATLNKSGELLSEKSFGGSSFDLGKGLAFASNGDLWLAGYSRSNDGDVSLNQGDNDMLILRLSPDKIVLNSFSLGGLSVDLAHDIIELSSGKIIVVGETESIDGPFQGNHGNKDLVVAQYH